MSQDANEQLKACLDLLHKYDAFVRSNQVDEKSQRELILWLTKSVEFLLDQVVELSQRIQYLEELSGRRD